MKKIFFLSGLVIYLVFLTNVTSCVNEKAENPSPNDYKIKLRWVKAYEKESWKEVKTGLIWAFCYLGAKLPEGSFDKAVFRTNESEFTLDISQLGISEEALKTVKPMLNVLKNSEEYQTKNGVDIGRFLMFTLYSSWHYYAITDVKSSLNEFKIQYFTNAPIEFYLSNSGVAKTQRIIRFTKPEKPETIAFLADEGNGKIENGTFEPESFETEELMPNGQLRFAIYDKNGKLKSNADTLYTFGGKPGKCQWCHEEHLQPLFSLPTDLPNSITKQEFSNYISQAQQIIEDYRKTLKTDIIYKNKQDHRFAELLYISFMEPSAERIASEWGMSKEEVLKKMVGFPTHTYPEYPFLGNLYKREWVDAVSPYKTIQVPESAREFSVYEPDIIGLSGK